MKHQKFRNRVNKVVARRKGEVKREDEWTTEYRFDSHDAACSAYFDLLVGKPKSVEMMAVAGRLIVDFE